MEDFNGLASSLAAGVSDVRGCLILSRDGLVLGSHPDEGETHAKPAWIRFAAIGDPERGFAQFGTEAWCYVRRGPYAAFSVVGPGARPGLVIDHMEQVLLAAEEARNSREAVRTEPEAAPVVAPVSKPRTTLHPERPLEEPVVITADVAPPAQGAAAGPPPEAPSTAQPLAPAEAPAPAEPAQPSPPPPEELPAPVGPPADVWGTGDDDDDVDRFSLAREFGQLLQDEQDGADG